MIFCTLWLVAAIIVTVYAVQWEIAALQGAAVSLSAPPHLNREPFWVLVGCVQYIIVSL